MVIVVFCQDILKGITDILAESRNEIGYKILLTNRMLNIQKCAGSQQYTGTAEGLAVSLIFCIQVYLQILLCNLDNNQTDKNKIEKFIIMW